MPKDRDIELFLNDILESISKIEIYTQGMDYKHFISDEKTKDAVVRNLEIIGEAVKNIPDDVKERHRDIDWKGAGGMRDKLIHEYFGANFAIVWETIKDDLPPFRERIEKILASIKNKE